MEFFNGQVIGLSKIATGTPAGFCRAVLGGNLSFPFNTIQKVGIAGQNHTRKGLQIPTLRFRCVGVDKADIAKWFPTSAGVQVATFPSFLVEVDDGSAGKEFVLSDGQPGPCTISLGEGPDAEVEYEFEAQFATVTPAAAGTKTPAYLTTYLGHTHNDVVFQIGGSDANILTFQLQNGVTLGEINACNTKSAGSKTYPSAFGIASYKPSLSVTVSNLYGVATWGADSDTAASMTIAMANGTAGQNITATLANWIYHSPEIPLEPEGLAAFPMQFIPHQSTVYNRVAFA